jgi:hypothetical protein
MKRYTILILVLLFYPVWLILLLILKCTIYSDQITKKHFMPWLFFKQQHNA